MRKILAINSISFKKRMIELLFDYLFILAYLALLFLGSMLFYTIFFLMVFQSLQKFSRSVLYFLPLFCQSFYFLHSQIIQKMGVSGRRKQDFNWFTRKKQCKLACLETPLNFFLGKQVIWARYMVSIVSLIPYLLFSRFQLLSSQLPYL